MDKKQLEDYRKLEKKIASLSARIAELEFRATQCEHGTVKGSNPHFPYEPMTFRVSGITEKPDEKRRQRIFNLKYELEDQKEEAERQRLEIQEFIAEIQDTTTQLIFTYKYLDGLNQQRIGDKLHMDQSRVSRKMNDYLKSHKKHKNL